MSTYRVYHPSLHLARSTTAPNAREARRIIRERLGVTKLPAGTIHWRCG